MSQEERLYWLAFSQIIGIGPKRFEVLRKYFGSAKEAFLAPESNLEKIGLPQNILKSFLWQKKNLDLNKINEELIRKQIGTLTTEDTEYPSLLKEISDPPFLFYYRGNLQTKLWERCVAVVGTRKPTSYGREVTEQITTDLASAGMTIVSGLARGVDSVAHRAALSIKGKTIAVLGAGIDVIYPPENAPLYQEIIEKEGLIISEVPPRKTVERGIFPARNRIVAGLSLGVVVTEGAKDSGSLITARLAAEYNREVFAVPGPINSPMSAAPLRLLKDGARLINGAQDILEELGLSLQIKPREAKEVSSSDPVENLILDTLKENGETNFDDLIRKTGLDSASAGTAISILELKGVIKQTGGTNYRINY